MMLAYLGKLYWSYVTVTIMPSALEFWEEEEAGSGQISMRAGRERLYSETREHGWLLL